MKLSWRVEPVEGEGADLLVDTVAEVETGPVIEVGEIRFEGLERTRLATVMRRVKSADGIAPESHRTGGIEAASSPIWAPLIRS